MAKIEFDLFRVKMIQESSNATYLSEDLLLKAIHEKPSLEFRQNFTWHIGNVTELESKQGWFAVGRTATTQTPKFNIQSGDFTELEDENSPHSYVAFNAHYGVVAVMRKSIIFQNPENAASVLGRILGSTVVATENMTFVRVEAIPDPEEFVQKLKNARKVKKFTATFTGPNPFDADAHFQKPLSAFAGAADATEGKASVQGEDLNREVLVEVAKSTASTGNNASARVQMEYRERTRTINLNGDPVRLVYDDSEFDIKQVIKDMMNEYRRVRDGITPA